MRSYRKTKQWLSSATFSLLSFLSNLQLLKKINAVFQCLLNSFVWCWEQISFVFRHRRRFGSDRNFILRIAPLRDKEHDSYRNYSPPPLYGTPLGKPSPMKEGKPETYAKYGLFLWPDKLNKYMGQYILLLFFSIVPFLTSYFMGCCSISLGFTNVALIYFGIAISVVSVVIMKLYFLFMFRASPPVLSRVWCLWPESQFDRFLTVPHLSELAFKDRKKTDPKTDHNQYWRPDKPTPLEYQPAYYAKRKNTLQEVILHLAVFDFLFYPRGTEKEEVNSLRMKGWLYLLSPAILAYVGLFITFFLSFIAYSFIDTGQDKALKLPLFYVPLILIWSVMTFNMIMNQMRFLKRLQKNVRKGYYNTHLEMVPQQILNAISAIPKDEQISQGLEQIKEILKFVQAGALVTFLIVLEIFSNG